MIETWEELIKPNHNLLDIGCWSGSRINSLKDKCNVYGIDINTNRFKEASKTIRKKLFYGDATKEIPFDIKFNWILLRDVLEHVEAEDALLENISGSLAEGGQLILSTPKHIPFFDYYDPAWVKWKFGGSERHKHYTKEELFNKLEEAGLIVSSYKICGNFKWLVSRWLNGFLKILRIKSRMNVDYTEGYFEWVVIAKKVRKNDW